MELLDREMKRLRQEVEDVRRRIVEHIAYEIDDDNAERRVEYIKQTFDELLEFIDVRLM